MIKLMSNSESNIIQLRFRQSGLSAENRNKLDRFVQSYGSELRRYLQRTLSKQEDIEDVFQETFCRVLEDERADSLENPAAFLQRTARNIVIDRYRRNRLQLESATKGLGEIGDYPQEDTFLDFGEMSSAYLEALAELPERCRQVFLMCRHDGLSNAEIAKNLGISMRMVQKHLVKALAHFHNRLR